MMYNPLVTYYPPLKADGTPVTIAAMTDANGNMGTTIALYAAVQRDVYLKMFAAGIKDNLQTRVSVPLYCNTDWPVTAGVNLAITDVGDLQGGPTSGVPLASPVGAYCRINGTDYGASAASGAPATAVAGRGNGLQLPVAVVVGRHRRAVFLSGSSATRLCGATTRRPIGRARPPSPPAMDGAAVFGGAPTKQTCVKNVDTFTCNPVVASTKLHAGGVQDRSRLRSIALPGTGGSGGNTPGHRRASGMHRLQLQQ